LAVGSRHDAPEKEKKKKRLFHGVKIREIPEKTIRLKIYLYHQK
jgi:hypothetical protein